MQDAADQTTSAPPRRRSWLRWPLGCLAFGIGGIAALVFLSGPLLSWLLPGWIEAGSREAIHGELDVQSLELSFRGRQRLSARLLDPEGASVGSLELGVEPLRTWVRSQGRQLGQSTLRFELDLVRSAEGALNLTRALAPRDGTTFESPGGSGGDRSGRDADLPDGAELVIEPSRLSFRDLAPGAPAPRVRIEGLAGRFSLRGGGLMEGHLTGQLVEPEPGSFELSLRRQGSGAASGAALEVTLTGEALPSGLFDALLAADGLLSEALGARFDVELELGLDGTGLRPDRGRGRLTLTSPRARAEQTLTFAPGLLSADPGGQLWLEPSEALWRRLWPAPPQGRRLAPGAGPLEIQLERLALRLPAAGTPIPPAELLAGLDLAARLALPNLTLAGPASAPAAGATLAALSLSLEQAPGARLSALLTGRIESPPRIPAPLTVRFEAAPWTQLWPDLLAGRASGGPLELRVDGLSSAQLDGLLASRGLCADVLGERLDLRLSAGELSLPLGDPLAVAGPLELELTSPRCTLRMDGRLADGLFESGAPADGREQLSFALEEVASRRLVGGLLPLLSQLSGPPSGQRAKLSWSELRLPLDGDLRRLDGRLRLDLGSADGSLLAPLAQLWPAAGRFQGQRLAPFELSIVGGRVGYSDLVLELAGQRLPFSGGYDLVGGRFEIDARLPLSASGGDLGKTLEQARRFLPADTAIPLRLSGRPEAPELDLGPGSSEILQQAAQRALEAGLLEQVGDKLPGLLEQAPVQLPGGLGGLLEQLKKKKSGGG